MKITDLDHIKKTHRIQKTVQELARSGRQAKMFHGSTNSTRPPIDPDLAIIDVSDLTNVLEINTKEGYVIAEPNVPLDALVKATARYGFAPPMVAEFPGITVGGAAQGGSGESSSHKYGLFSDTCLEYEVILGNGEILTCSKNEYEDLFHGLACAFGSLGVLSAVKVTIVPVEKYVKMTYIPTRDYSDTLRALKKHTAQGPEFIDAIQLSKDSGVIVIADYSRKKGRHFARFSYAWNDWFYLHVQKQLSRGIHEEFTTLSDYLFRYDRGGFWVAKYGFNGTQVPFNRLSRLVLAGLFKTRTLFKLLHSSGYSYRILAQDVCLPEETVEKFLEFNDETSKIYPLWICPLKPATDKLAPTALNTNQAINIGIWGESAEKIDFKTQNRQIEQKVHELGGRKVLYAQAYYTPNEYWDIYPKQWHEELREKYHATTLFPNVYQKTLTKPSKITPSKKRALKGLLRSPYKK